MNKRDARGNLEAILSRRGLRSALVFLNGLTAHRFTAVYHSADGEPTPLCIFDRLNPWAEATPDDSSTFCLPVSGFLRPPHSLGSAPMNGSEIQSYCGVPLEDENGTAFGFICHFDFRPVPVNLATIELLEEAARLLTSASPRLRALIPAEM